MDLDLFGKRVLISGGTKGIGRSCVELFYSEGSSVSFCSRSSSDASNLATTLDETGNRVRGFAVDVANTESVVEWVEAAASFMGGIDIIVANVSAFAEDEGELAWKSSFQVDLMHTVTMVEASLKYLKASQSAAICGISSVSAIEIDSAGPAYGAMKAAIVHYMKWLSRTLGPYGIRSNSISPGNVYFEGGIWQYIEDRDPEQFSESLEKNPFDRMATPNEIACSVAFICSPRSSFTSGTNLLIDGALSAGVHL